MAVYSRSATNAAVGGASEAISTAALQIAVGDVIEVTCTTAAGAWVNYKGGAATVGGADCFYVAPGGFVVFTAQNATINAIREAGTDAVVTVSVLGATP